MQKAEFALHYHEMVLQCELFRRNGKSFQDFFELIMQKLDPSFMMVKPMGRVGDWKSDGYSPASGTVYQCYAPEEMTAAASAKKVEDDFKGAKNYWKEKMKRWVFVWSSEVALPPQVAAKFAKLKQEYSTIEIVHMGRAGLWEIVKHLSAADRESLLGVVPDVKDVPATTAIEIQVLVKHLGHLEFQAKDFEGLELTAIADKLRRNSLSDHVTAIVRPSTPVAKLVREFVTRMPDPAFSQAIALDLKRKYTELAAKTNDPDTIFGGIVDYVLGEHRSEPKYFWAASGIVTHYFELCDIFEG